MVLNLPLFAKTSENLSGYSLTRPYIYGSGPTYIADLHRDGTVVSSENIEITPSTDSSIQTYSLQFMSTNGDSSEKIFIRLQFDSNGSIVRADIDGNSNAAINHSDNEVTVTMSTHDGKTLTSRLQISKPTKQ